MAGLGDVRTVGERGLVSPGRSRHNGGDAATSTGKVVASAFVGRARSPTVGGAGGVTPQELRRQAARCDARAVLLAPSKADRLRAVAREMRLRASEREHRQDDGELPREDSTLRSQGLAAGGLVRP